MDFRAIFLIVSLVGLGGCLASLKEGPIGERGGSYNRQAWASIPDRRCEERWTFRTHVYFPKTGTVPFSSVVFSHGSPRGRSADGILQYASEMVHRLGLCGRAPCNEAMGVRTGIGAKTTVLAIMQTMKAELATSHDSLAALDNFSGQGFVDPNLVVMIEQSRGRPRLGGSRQPEAARRCRVVNFRWPGSRGSGSNCSPEHLVDATGHFGRTTTILNIWIHPFGRRLFRVQDFAVNYAAFDATSGASRFRLY